MRKNVFKLFSNILFVILLIIAGLLFYRNIFFISLEIDGSSMAPTLQQKDKGYASKLDVKRLQRFDIIVFNSNEKSLIKRIIGLPGESIEFKGYECDLYINDTYYYQDFINDDYKKLTCDNASLIKNDMIYHIPDDSYFVLGDNRGASFDSNHGLGLIKKEQILGVLTCIIRNNKLILF